MSKLKSTSSIILFCLLLTCCTTMPEIYVPDQKPPVQKMDTQPRVALVLSGGAARGYAHVGVIQALERAGVPIDLIVGASAGTIVGALYADSADANQVKQIMIGAGFFDFADFAPVYRLGGLISGNQLQRFLINNMDARDFSELKIKLVTVSTDLLTGDAVKIESGPVAPAINASAALPGLLQPVELYGHTLVDGGIVEPIPVSYAQYYHPEIIISVDVTTPLSKRIPKSGYGIYSRAYDILWKRLENFTAEGSDIIIRPQVADTSRFSLRDKQRLIEAGEQAATDALPEINTLLKAHNIDLDQ